MIMPMNLKKGKGEKKKAWSAANFTALFQIKKEKKRNFSRFKRHRGKKKKPSEREN